MVDNEIVWLTDADLAVRFQVSRRTVQIWEADGRLPAGVRLGGRCLRWRRDVIERHEAALLAGAGPGKPDGRSTWRAARAAQAEGAV